jgi:hypothetical protein
MCRERQCWEESIVTLAEAGVPNWTVIAKSGGVMWQMTYSTAAGSATATPRWPKLLLALSAAIRGCAVLDRHVCLVTGPHDQRLITDLFLLLHIMLLATYARKE